MTQTDPNGIPISIRNLNDRGFSLIEVMVAVCILAVGLMAVAAMQVGAINANAQASGTAEAAAIAERQMEALSSLSYRFDLAADNNNHPDLVETTFVFDPTDMSTYGLYNPFPVNRSTFDPAAYNLTNPSANTFPPDHWRLEGRYTVMWNIKTDIDTIANTKTVQVLVAWDDGGSGRYVSIRRVLPRIN